MAMDDHALDADVRVTPDGGVKVTTTPATQNAGRFDFAIEEGASLYLPIAWYNGQTAVQLLASGYTAKLEAWKSWNATAAVLSLTESAGITLFDTAPNIEIARTAIQTQALDFVRAVYSLTLTGGGTSRRILTGTITLRPMPVVA